MAVERGVLTVGRGMLAVGGVEQSDGAVGAAKLQQPLQQLQQLQQAKLQEAGTYNSPNLRY